MPDPVNTDNLTRWNRAGLERFRYIDGNAVTYLETMRENFSKSFTQWKKVQEGAEENEPPSLRQKRITDQYQDNRRDWGWETARAIARSTHILTEHINAFANEGYLSTATQWEYLRRLVSMLDYRPLPPASAFTYVALIIDPEATPGLVRKGLQAKYASEDTGISLVFETLKDIEVDSRLNGIRLKGFDHNPNGFRPFSDHDLWVAPEKAKVNVGQYAVLIQGQQAFAAMVDSVEEQVLGVELADNDKALPSKFILGDTRLGIVPDQVYVPALNGTDTVQVSKTDLFSDGQIVAWSKGKTHGFARVLTVDKTGIRLTDITPNIDVADGNINLYQALPISKKQKKANGGWLVPKDTGANIVMIAGTADGTLTGEVQTPTLIDVKDMIGTEESEFAKKIPEMTAHVLYYFDPSKQVRLGAVKPARSLNRLRIEGGIGKCRSGNWFVAESENGTVSCVQAAILDEKDNHFIMELENAPAGFKNIAFLYGPFNYDVHPVGHNRDPDIVDLSTIELDVGENGLPDIFVPGKTIIFESENEDSGVEAFNATIVEVIRNDASGGPLDYPVVKFTLPVSLKKNFNRGEVIIRGNVVEFGHGEAQPLYILGSGDAAEIRQSFVLPREDVAFIADNSLESGVRADFALSVAGQYFEEVSSLTNSDSIDASFETYMTEDGHVKICFGDGRHGRRLPTGRNNISIIYRKGTGSVGNNVPPYSFEKPSKPHARVEKLRQPIATSGGQNMEDIDQVRTNAPDHLRSLGRGVSLADFEHIGRTTPGIWHAKAMMSLDTVFRQDLIHLCIVPADDAPLGSLGADLETRLRSLSSPNQVFSVERFDPVPLELAITLRVDSKMFDQDKVEADVRAAVFDTFKLKNRAPAEALFSSQIYEIVENIFGVSNSRITIFPGRSGEIKGESGDPVRSSSRDGQGQLSVVWPTDCQSVYLRKSAHIGITVEEALI